MSDSSDAEDLRRAVLGDESAAARLYQRHGRRLFALAHHMLRDPERAEDVVQDSFLRLWVNASAILSDRKIVGAWLTRVASNRSIDLLRRRREVLTDKIPEGPIDAPGPDDALHSAKLSAEVRDAMDILPARQKAALILTVYLGQSNQEAGKALGISEQATESLLARARRSMRQMLAHRRRDLLGED